jgi:hypothetical protein
MNVSVVYLKHTGTEVICDLIEMNEENMAVTIKDPHVLQVIGSDGNSSTMGLLPFGFASADNVLHISIKDILFISECKGEIADNYERMMSPLDLPTQKIII